MLKVLQYYADSFNKR